MKKMRAELKMKKEREKNGVEGPGIETRGKRRESAVGSSSGGCN